MRARWLAVFLLMLSSTAARADVLDWWLTNDQQGRYHFERGDHVQAARAFELPMWRALAFYAAGDFGSAAAQFESIGTAEALFYLGNARAHQGELAATVAAYEQALTLRSEFPEATFNLDWVRGLLDLEQMQYEDVGGTDGQLGADEIVFDERGEDAVGTMTGEELQAQGLSDAELEEMWMRRVQTTPGDFLRLKFAYQRQRGEDAE